MKSVGIVCTLLACALFGGPAQAQSTTRLVPIVDNSGMLLGAARSGQWLSWEKTYPLLKGGEKYRFYTRKGYAKTYAGSKPELSQSSGQAYYIRFPQRAPGEGSEAIGLGGDWNPMPRLPRLERTNQQVYRNAVAALLKEKGLSGVRPNITRIVRVDLWGKGQDAVVIEAASPGYKLSANDTLPPDAYSCVMVVIPVGGKLKTVLLDGVFHKKGGESSPAELFRLGPILDLNGDGVLEIVVEATANVSNRSAVYEIKSGAPRKVLEAADGD